MKTTYTKPETEEIEMITECHLNESSPKTLNKSNTDASVTNGYYDSLSRESDWDE